MSGVISLEQAQAEDRAAKAWAWPVPLEREAFHGLVGRFVRTIAPHSEADEAALLGQFLTTFGSATGRSPHFLAEADRHGVNTNVVCVGETAKGRKGTSWGHVRRVIVAADPDWERRIMTRVSRAVRRPRHLRLNGACSLPAAREARASRWCRANPAEGK